MSHPPGPPQGGEPGPRDPQSQAAYYPPPQYAPPGFGPGPLPHTNGKATASLITGVSTLVLSPCCGLGIAGVVAVVLGVKARREIRVSGGVQGGDGMAIGGIVTGALAVLVGIAAVVLVVVILATGNADFDTNTTYGTNP